MHTELDRIRNIISVFGLTFIAGAVLNALKGYYLIKFVDVMVSQPLIFCIFSVLFSLLIELFPVVIIYNMHKTNFAEVNEAESHQATTILSQSDALTSSPQSLSSFQNSLSKPSTSSSQISNSIELLKGTGLVCGPVVLIVEGAQKAHSHEPTIVSRGFDKLLEHGDLHGSIKEKDHKRRQHLSKSTSDS